MSYPPYTQLDLSSAEELWAKLSPTNTLFSSPSKLIYRGQANANWQLLPSALRQSERARALGGMPGDLTVDLQIFYEMRLLEMFGEFCDQVGVRIPGDSITFRQNALTTQRNFIAPEQWPAADLLETMALAQHHGIPTRLLDWSKNPYAAVYFACASAFNECIAGSNHDRMAVWVLNIETINIYRKHVYLVRPPGSTTPNLAAQAGLFTVQKESGRRGELLRPVPLEHAFSAIPQSPLLKLTVPTREGLKLFTWCGRMGITAATMYPGADGAAKAVLDAASSWRAERLLEGE
jgi:hypothetical protein